MSSVEVDNGYIYDVAISFAGAQRDLAEYLANRVRDADFEVFYDRFDPQKLWGEDLAVKFLEVFRDQARYCLILVSEEYRDRVWTLHELRSAVERAIGERGNSYILQVKVDAIELPGIHRSLGYLSLAEYPPETIADILVAKLDNELDTTSVLDLIDQTPVTDSLIRQLATSYRKSKDDFDLYFSTIPKWPSELTIAFARRSPDALSQIVRYSAENLPDHFSYHYMDDLARGWGDIYRSRRNKNLRTAAMDALISVGVRFDENDCGREIARIVAAATSDKELEIFGALAYAKHGSGPFLKKFLERVGVLDQAKQAVRRARAQARQLEP